MASTVETTPLPRGKAQSGIGSGFLDRVLLPSYSDCLFVAVLTWLFAAGSGGWVGLLADGDTGWHIRTGEWILANKTVPLTDLFSFSKAGQPWFAWEWLTDILYAFLHRNFGMKGLLLLTAFVITGAGTLLFRHLIWRRSTPFAALLVTLLVLGASTIHYLARPHVFTLLGMTVAAWLVDADRRRQSGMIWLLAPITLVWVNLHGGFLALIACLGLLAMGTAVEQMWNREREGDINWQPVKRYSLLTALCGVVTFANPYGWNLHLHIAKYLRSDWIKDNVQEFQSPSFRTESMMQFEVVLFLGVLTAGWMLTRRDVVGALWILFWAHSALTSVRHVPIFMIVAAPGVAMGLTEMWNRSLAMAPKNSFRGIFASLGRDMEPGCQRTSIWIGVVVMAFILLPGSVMKWPADFPDVKFPAKLVQKHAEKIIAGRTLTMDQWGDYLIYRNYPRQKVFIDGRSDFFGKEVGTEYVRIMQGHWEWDKLMDKYQFDVVLSPNGWPLASLLKRDSRWRLVEDDGMALLFERVGQRVDLPVPTGKAMEGNSGKKASVSPNENPSSRRT